MTGPAETDPAPSPEPAPEQPSPAELRDSRRIIATTLTATGVLTLVIAIVLGIVIDPLLFTLVLVGLFDLVFARLFASGRIGGADPGPTEAAVAAEADPSYNPYARED